MNKDINQVIREQKGKEYRIKLYYLIWSVMGVIVVAFSIFMNIKKAGDGIVADMFIGYFVYILSRTKLKTSLLVIACVSIIEFTAYSTYCLNGSAFICQRNLFIMSGIPLFFFGISKIIMSAFGYDKSRRW